MNRNDINTEIDNIVATGAGLKAIDFNPLLKLLTANFWNIDNNPIVNNFLDGGALAIASAQTVKNLKILHDDLAAIVATNVTQLEIDTAVTFLIDEAPIDANTLGKLDLKILAIQTLIGSNNVNLDSVQELVDAIEDVQTWMDTILVNNLVDGGVSKALTAEQGKVLKTILDLKATYFDLQAVQDFLQAQIDLKANITYVDALINALLNGVPVDGNTLNKLNDKILAIQTLIGSDNVNLDSVQELVDAIENVQTWINTILVNNLVDGGIAKALTAEQGKVLKALIDNLGTVYQAILVSGTNIKTISELSVLGTGNIYSDLWLSRQSAIRNEYLTTASTSDFINSVNGGGSNFAGAVGNLPDLGVVQFQLGSANGNFVKSMCPQVGVLRTNSAKNFYEAFVSIASLGSATQPYTERIGLLNSVNDVDLGNGLHFKYNYVISPNWLLVSSNGTTNTIVDSGFPVAVNGFNKLSIILDLGVATFYINGASIGTINTNIPLNVGYGICFFRSAVATSNLILAQVGYQEIVQLYKTPR